MLVDPQIAGFAALWALLKWIKQEPWLALPLLLSLFVLALCGAKGSFLHRMYTPETVVQIRDFSTAVLSVDLFIILCRRDLRAWLTMGIPIVVVIWWSYFTNPIERILKISVFYTFFFTAGAMVSTIWPDKKPEQEH